MQQTLPIPRSSLIKIPSQQRSVNMVHGIIDAAVAVLQHEGHLGFTTHRVARRAGISVGSLYQYFANKEMILSAIVERGVLQADMFMGALFRQHADLPLEQILTRAVQGVNRLVAPYRDAIREILTATPLLADTSLLGLLRRPFVNIASDYFARNADRYELVGGHATLLVTVDTTIFMILRRWADISPVLDDETYYQAYIRLLTSQVRELGND